MAIWFIIYKSSVYRSIISEYKPHLCTVSLQNALYYMDLGDALMHVVGLVVCEVFVQSRLQLSLLYLDIFNSYPRGVNSRCYLRRYERLTMDGEKYTTPRDTRDRLERSEEGGASLVGDSHGASDSTTSPPRSRYHQMTDQISDQISTNPTVITFPSPVFPRFPSISLSELGGGCC